MNNKGKQQIGFTSLFCLCVSGVSNRETAERPVGVEAANRLVSHTQKWKSTHTHTYIVNSMYGRSRYIKQSFQKRGDYLIVCLMKSKGEQ